MPVLVLKKLHRLLAKIVLVPILTAVTTEIMVTIAIMAIMAIMATAPHKRKHISSLGKTMMARY